MMNRKQLLHELLKEDQEPFQLKTYIAQRQSQPGSTLQLSKRNPIVSQTLTKRNNLCRRACFFAFQNSPDVNKSPFRSPAKSPCKSLNGAVFLHIPSKTAALLAEAAMRIQKQQSKSDAPNLRFGMLGSFLKRLKNRNKGKKSAIRSSDFRAEIVKIVEGADETGRVSCSCSADWTEDNKYLDFEASISNYGSDDFRFSSRKSLSTADLRTPDFCSPVASPSCHVGKENEKYERQNSDKVQGEEGEQCSPVSVLDPPFEDDETTYHHFDLDCTYANVQKAKEQLLRRLQRFEKLAELDPMELERRLLEVSDDDNDDNAEPLSPRHNIDTLVSQVFNNSMKKFVSEENGEGMVVGRIRFDKIDTMIGLEWKGEGEGWAKFTEQVEETAAEMEVVILGMLVEEIICC